jgi:hypothetical protein
MEAMETPKFGCKAAIVRTKSRTFVAVDFLNYAKLYFIDTDFYISEE